MDDLLNRQLPYSAEAEQSVLGSMLFDPRCIDVVVDLLNPEDFYIRQNREICQAVFSMHSLSQTIDPVTVLNRLKSMGVYDESGGRAYISQLLDITPSAANVSAYCRIVRDKSLLRQMATAANEINELVVAQEGETDSILEVAEQKVYAVRNGNLYKGLTPISQVLVNVYNHLEELAKNKGKLPGIPTGFAGLDNVLAGLNNSDFIMMASRPGMGKTSIALNLALNAAKQSGKAVAFFSLEMANEQLALRLLSNEARVDSKKLRTGLLGDNDWADIARASATLSGVKLYFDDTAGITVPKINAKCRRMGSELGLVVIDYLQLMHSEKRTDNRVNEVSEISRSLKMMAKELNVPVLCLSQLSREVEKRENKRPRLSDLRESGSIEQDADIVILIHRDDYYTKEASEAPNITEFIIEKNRHGELATVKLFWEGQYTRFSTLTGGPG